MTVPQALAALRHARDTRNVAAVERLAASIRAEFTAEGSLLHAAGHALLTLGSLDAAVGLLEAALAVTPRPEIANDLGVALQRRGEIERAIAYYRTALDARVDYVEANANLAAALYLTGGYAEALPHALAAHHAAPDAPGCAITLALIEGAIGGYECAIERLDRSAPLETTRDVAALIARVYALRRMERTAEAALVVERIFELAPDAIAYEMLAVCRRDRGAYEEALELLDVAIATSPNPAGALALAGETLLDVGRIDAARARFEQAVAADSASIAAWNGLTQTNRFGPDDPEIGTMERLLETPALAMREERILLLFALGRAHLGAGNDARAFEYFAEANRLKRATIAYDVASDERRMDAIAAALDATTIANLRGDDDAAPIVVMGLPRSGTSLVEQILASLPGVHGAGETAFARTAIEAIGPYPASVPSFTRDLVAAMARSYREQLGADAPPGARIVDKMPSNFLYAGVLHAMLPNARLVFCSRDLGDTGLSLYTMLFAGRQDFAYDLDEIRRYATAQRRLVEHWKRVLPADSFIEIRYEDIVADFEPQVRRLLAFCGLAWDEAVHRFHETPRRVATASRIDVRRPLYATSVGRAQRYAPYLEPLIGSLRES